MARAGRAGRRLAAVAGGRLLPRSGRREQFLWACALVPFFIVPPLFSLIYAIRALRRSSERDSTASAEWIAIVSAVNVAVSVAVLYEFSASPIALLESVASSMRGLLDLALRQFPFGSKPAPGIGI